MDITKKYITSIVAIKSNGQGMKYDHLPIRIEAESTDEADEKALEIAKQRWPTEDGWSDHHAVSLLA